MVRQLDRLGQWMVSRVAPEVKADAAAAACYTVTCCCVSGCALFWQNKLKYDRICNGVFQYSYYSSCGACAA